MDSNQVDPENNAQEVNAESGPRSVHGYKWFLAAISLYVAVFVYALDGTIAADIQSSIIEQFNDAGSLTWIGTGFPLGSLCFILPSWVGMYKYVLWSGQSANSSSEEPVFTPSLTSSLFLSWASWFLRLLLRCVAPHLTWMLSLSVESLPALVELVFSWGEFIAQAEENALTYASILNFLSVLTTDQERGKYISLMGVTWGVGAVLGPVVGGAFSSSSATWRWSFYINLWVNHYTNAPCFLLRI